MQNSQRLQRQKSLQDVCSTIRCPFHNDQFISFLNVSKIKEPNYQRCRCSTYCSVNLIDDIQLNSLHLLFENQLNQDKAFIELQQISFQKLKKIIVQILDKKKEEFLKRLEEQYKCLEQLEKETNCLINELLLQNELLNFNKMFNEQESGINWTTLNKIGDILSNKLRKNEKNEWILIENVISQDDKNKIIEKVNILQEMSNLLLKKQDDQSIEITMLSGHKNTVNEIAISYDENWFASASDDSTIKLWDAYKLQLERTFHHQQGQVLTVAFSQSNDTLISAGFDTQIYIWNIFENNPKNILKGHTYSVFQVILTKNDIIFSCSGDSSLRLWNNNNQIKCELEAIATRMAIQEQQNWLGLALTNGQVCLINDLSFKQQELIYVDAHDYECTGISFSNDNYFSTCGQNKENQKIIKIWMLCSQPYLCRIVNIDIQPFNIKYSENNELIIINSIKENQILIYSNYGFTLLYKLQVPKGYSGQTNIYKSACITIANDNKYIITGGYDNNIKYYKLKV